MAIELIDAYEYLSIGMSNRATTVAKVKQGRKYVYLVPYGIDYECEGGHHIEILSEEEFLKRFSLVYVRGY